MLVALSALLLVTAYLVPIWQILMWAPQYPEGLEMKIWIDNITGDVNIISALNHYIGMKHINVEMFPEFHYMIYILAVLILLGLVAALFNRSILLTTYLVALIGCGMAALIDFYRWGYNYGHNLDPKAPIVVPGMSYQPPLIGTKQLLNFTAFSGPDIGGWIFLVAGLMAFGAFVWELIRLRQQRKLLSNGVAIIIALLLAACSVSPEPIRYGVDACYHCKMTMVDDKFGAEVVTQKGKVYKFDDSNCLTAFLQQSNIKTENIAHFLIIDWHSPGTLIDARQAFYVRADQLNSPMAGNVAAFATREQADHYREQWQGTALDWNTLTQPQ